ncbi:AraC family transcriptional regulator [Flavobacterium sp.]|uniref:helix-turn-helix domain-containing protein n=1 Tax=Flavobacterium sp. TaxID=239 RepID=UPI00121C4CEB|nr:helix-turn-helix domain-containing protein [Flavobacterium sp.]RZJ69670.1 MAG: AraC family transcriptional regulator [Flavobacterium sp.]
MDFNLLISTLIGGGLALLAFLKMSNVLQVNRKANFFFGLFCLLWSSFWLDNMVDRSFLDRNYGFSFALKVAQFLTGVVFLMSIRFYANPRLKLSLRDLLMLLVPIVFVGFLMFRKTSDDCDLFYTIFSQSHSFVYIVLSYLTIKRHGKNIEQFASEVESIDLRWIKYIIYSLAISLIVVLTYKILKMRQPLNVYINLHMLTVVYFVAFYGVRQKEIFPRGLPISDALATSSGNELSRKTKLMEDDELLSVKKQLIRKVESESLYLDCELNLVKLAEIMQLSTHQLSYVINNGTGENFFNFINRFRVKKAETLLTDANFDQLTIVTIGFESGFNSKTAFNTAFKKITGFTPTEFRKSNEFAKQNTVLN